MPTPLPYAWPCNLINHMPRKDQVTLTLPGHRHRHCNRWTRRASSLTTIRTSEIIPVELNSILYRNERALAWLHQMWAELRGTHGDQSFGKSPSTPSDREAPRVDYAAAAAARLAGMSAWMWDGESARWHDLDLSAQPTASRLAQESAASYMPLWARACEPEQAARAVNALSKSRLLQVGGISTTLEPTGQQWDWPNAWPPLQQMLLQKLKPPSKLPPKPPQLRPPSRSAVLPLRASSCSRARASSCIVHRARPLTLSAAAPSASCAAADLVKPMQHCVAKLQRNVAALPSSLSK